MASDVTIDLSGAQEAVRRATFAFEEAGRAFAEMAQMRVMRAYAQAGREYAALPWHERWRIAGLFARDYRRAEAWVLRRANAILAEPEERHTMPTAQPCPTLPPPPPPRAPNTVPGP